MYLGIDLAWKHTRASRTGLAAVDHSGRLVASTRVRSDDEIALWAGSQGRAHVVAIDAPLVVPNASGARDCERRIGRAFGKYGASAYPSSRANPLFNPPRARILADRLGWNCDPQAAAPVCLEVYPHPGMIALFGLPYRLGYKRGPQRRAEFERLIALMSTIPELGLDQSSRWSEIAATVADPRPGDLDRTEDEVDAIFCAHLAWLWENQRDTLTVYGDAERGFIVAPPPPTG